jgi:hypothetical protein
LFRTTIIFLARFSGFQTLSPSDHSEESETVHCSPLPVHRLRRSRHKTRWRVGETGTLLIGLPGAQTGALPQFFILHFSFFI